jgi:hypothetical protein
MNKITATSSNFALDRIGKRSPAYLAAAKYINKGAINDIGTTCKR